MLIRILRSIGTNIFVSFPSVILFWSICFQGFLISIIIVLGKDKQGKEIRANHEENQSFEDLQPDLLWNCDDVRNAVKTSKSSKALIPDHTSNDETSRTTWT